MNRALIVVARKVEDWPIEVVLMWEYDPIQRDQAIKKYKELETDPEFDDVYFAEIIKEKH